MDEIVARTEAGLYDRDFYAWARQQAALMRDGRLDALDLDNVIEEIETLGRKEASELRSRYAILALHLLKMIYQPKRSTRSWRTTIVDQRWDITEHIEDSPSLKPQAEALFERAYAKARRLAATETGLPLERFPPKAPFTLDQAMAEGWYPGHDRAAGDD